MTKNYEDLVSIYIVNIKYENNIPIFGEPISHSEWNRIVKLKARKEKLEKIKDKNE
jgi:hypothetical protein